MSSKPKRQKTEEKEATSPPQPDDEQSHEIEDFEKCEICFEEYNDNENANKPFSLYPCGKLCL